MPNLWEETKDPVTEKSSLTENITPRVVKTWCNSKKHYFEWENGSSRTAICTKCGWEVSFIPGQNKLVNGQIVITRR